MASPGVCVPPPPGSSLAVPSVLLPPRSRTLPSEHHHEQSRDSYKSTRLAPPPAPLPSFRLPANPFPSSPSKSAPSTPAASSRQTFFSSPRIVEFEPFVPTPLPLPVRHTYPPPRSYLHPMSSTSSVLESDVEFEQFHRDGSIVSHHSDATYDGYGQYEECTPAEPFYSSTPRSLTTEGETFVPGSRLVDGRMSQEKLGKRSWNDRQYTEEASHQFASHKRMRIEPITPITPSSSYSSAPHHSDPYSSSHVPVARTLSYGVDDSYSRTNSQTEYGEDLRPLSARSSFSQPEMYHDVSETQQDGFSDPYNHPSPDSASASSLNTPFLTCTTAQTSYFEDVPYENYQETPRLLASPLLIPQSAPIERGHFQPYPDVESASMAVSYSLPQPPQQHLSTPRQGRTIHSKREDEFQYSSPLSTPRHEYPQSRFQLHSPISPQPTCIAPALVPIPSSSTPPNISRRSSNASSYTPNQAALVSAASMNRLLSRFQPTTPTKATSSSPQQRSPPSKGPAVSAIHPRYREPPPPRPVPVSPTKTEKMHTCVEHGCGKRFKRLEHLKRHERTHTLEKPYGCDIPGCGRYFSRSDNLAQHRKTHERNGKTSRAMAAAAAARAAAGAAAIAATGPY